MTRTGSGNSQKQIGLEVSGRQFPHEALAPLSIKTLSSVELKTIVDRSWRSISLIDTLKYFFTEPHWSSAQSFTDTAYRNGELANPLMSFFPEKKFKETDFSQIKACDYVFSRTDESPLFASPAAEAVAEMAKWSPDSSRILIGEYTLDPQLISDELPAVFELFGFAEVNSKGNRLPAIREEIEAGAGPAKFKILSYEQKKILITPFLNEHESIHFSNFCLALGEIKARNENGSIDLEELQLQLTQWREKKFTFVQFPVTYLLIEKLFLGRKLRSI